MGIRHMIHAIFNQISDCFRKCNHDYYSTLEESRFDIARLARETNTSKEQVQPVWMS